MILAFDTSTRAGSVALRRADGDTRLEELDTVEQHSAGLVPLVQRLMRTFAPPDERLDAVVVGLGPGSFTGTRIGVASALGIRAARGCDLYGIPSFDAVALETARREAADGGPAEPRRIAVVAFAREATLYAAFYRADPDAVIRPEGPCRLIAPDELAAARPARIASPDPERVFSRLGAACIPLPDRWRREAVVPRADCLLDLVHGRARLGVAPYPPGVAPEPIYLHPAAKPPPPSARI